MDYDVIVVGGGPAGLIASKEIAGEGYKVCVIEEHQEIGYPVKCSGLYSVAGLRALDINLDENVISNTIRGGRFYSPSGKELLAYSNMERARVVEKKLFDKFLAREAAAEGVEIKLKTVATGVKVGERVAVNISGIGGSSTIKSELLIGADGIGSRVARWAGLETPKKIVSAVQVEADGVDVEEDIAEMYFGKAYAPNFYAWILPKDELCEIGVGVRSPAQIPREYLEKFMRKHPVASRKIKGKSRLEFNRGGIPVEVAGETVQERIMIVGDAAGHTKATTGGGVITGGIAARIAGRACIKALTEEKFSKHFLKRNYEDKWREEIGHELEVHSLLRTMLDSLSDEKLEKLFDIAIRENIAGIMTQYSDTDRPSGFVRELLSKPSVVDALQDFLDIELLK